MIFYFSATGNSKHLAKVICENSGEKLVDITECIRENKLDFKAEDGERLGFVMPVYFYGVPSCVLEFIEKMNLTSCGESYAFSAFTCGATTAGAGKMLEKALSKKGIRLSARFAVSMVDNYIPMYEISNKSEALAKLAKAKPEMEKIALQVKNKESGDFDCIKGPQVMTKFLYPLYKPFRSTKRFFATDACTGCGICEKGCVSRAIEIKNGKPVWVKKSCTNCLRCIHSCPQRAIQLGKATEKRNRYINPYA